MITLPLRLGLSATRLGFHLTGQAAGMALRITRLTLGGTAPTESREAPVDRWQSSSTWELDVIIGPPEPPPEAAPAATGSASEATAASTEPAPAGPAPEILPSTDSDGVKFVEALAEPGAEAGAGAAVHVREPWKGYARMTANDVIARLAQASREELAAVTLYEVGHRGRKTVLAAARRQLRSASAATGLRAQAGGA
ncbi:MAG TPA: hypothetical protein VLP43_05955 [Solirubrobacteraceae bacterium]|nr:hypothetical protein [Solirubrobacteraceae bacterium]